VAAATLARRLAAIAARHRDHNLSSPTRHAVVLATFRGIRRAIGTAQEAKDPLLTEDVLRLLEACPHTLSGLRDKACSVSRSPPHCGGRNRPRSALRMSGSTRKVWF
jgi:hypothetical protein